MRQTRGPYHKHMHIIESLHHKEDLHWQPKEITLQQWCNLLQSLNIRLI